MINHIELAKKCMTRENIDQIWNQALHDSVKDGEQFTRYHFANAVIEMCAKVAEEVDCGYGSEEHIRALKVKE